MTERSTSYNKNYGCVGCRDHDMGSDAVENVRDIEPNNFDSCYDRGAPICFSGSYFQGLCFPPET